jgi:hypothetical protein
MNNRIIRPYLAAIHRILISVMGVSWVHLAGVYEQTVVGLIGTQTDRQIA